MKYIRITITVVLFISLLLFFSFPNRVEVDYAPEARGCDFVVKTTGDEYYIEVPKKGVYQYELSVEEDGYVTVWKCS